MADDRATATAEARLYQKSGEAHAISGGHY
jgi:hypothetical protein